MIPEKESKKMLTFFLFCIVAYLIGSIPTGKLLAKMRGIDIQTVGTKNIGASNMFVSVSKKLGFVVLLGDLGKAFFTLLISLQLFSFNQTMIAALFLLIGNIKSIFLNFTGGKGVATLLGIFLAIEPLLIFLIAALWFLGVAIKKYMLLSGLGALFVIPYHFSTYGEIALIVSFLIILLVLVRHKENFINAAVGQFAKKENKTT